MDELEYITNNALMMCDQGGAPGYFIATHNKTAKVHGLLVATNKDGAPLVNIPSFKICKITKGPCTPATKPDTWQNTWEVKVLGSRTLLGESTIKCPVGGTIEFLTSGQVPLPPEAEAEVKELQDLAQRTLNDNGYGDSVGETGFVEGMIPVWGSGRDMINDIQTGDVGGALLNTGFLIWDVASIAAGVVSFGGGTALMQGAKAGVKGAVKTAAKTISREALQQLGKQAFKTLNKEALQKGLNEMAQKLMCTVVKACFTGETPVHTAQGIKPIREIGIGDEVYSFDHNTQKTVLRKVSQVFVEEVTQVLEVETSAGTIRTTASHPFFVNGGFRDAGQMLGGDLLFSKQGGPVTVKTINHTAEAVKVYNFEVEESHCYFVGDAGVLVLNKCYITTFFNAYPWLKGKVVVHHAVEQQVLKKYPGLFTRAEIDALDNLRGIPKHLNSDLHLSKIRVEWNKFYKAFENAGVTPTKQQLLDYARAIDKKFSNLYDPPFSVWPR
ncbi:MAG: DUF4280 domain-containing protein [Dinghuibacter sp.]|nr:DUF4280 domain-containing protein [Dinghuibacter sp.]